MPKTAHYSPFTTHRPAARRYHSALSLWLSVDPLSDKYPNLSPYVYCANNPVGLVDRDGRTWETPEDKEIADNLTRQAQNNINTNNNRVTTLSSNKFKAFLFKKEIINLKKENSYLEEGIENIANMGNDATQVYHFEYVSIGDGGVFKTSRGTQNILYRNYAMAWHETVHIGDARTNHSLWGFNKESYLGTTDENFYKSEVRAYSSQYSFDHYSMRSWNNATINSLDGVKEWININTEHKYYKK